MTKDSLLYKIIELDFDNKGAKVMVIEDVLAENPVEIEIESNQVIYAYHFYTNSQNPYKVQAISPTQKVIYSNFNSVKGSNNSIKAHWGNLRFLGEVPPTYFVQYLLITFK